jgi:hypothetical protein
MLRADVTMLGMNSKEGLEPLNCAPQLPETVFGR